MLKESASLHDHLGNPPPKKVVYSSPLSAVVSGASTPTISTLVDCLLQSIGTTLVSLPKLDPKDQSLAIANLTRSLSQLQGIQKIEDKEMAGLTTEELEDFISKHINSVNHISDASEGDSNEQ